jgi:hypothetical protein
MIAMKLKTIGLTAVSSLLGIALSQSVDARTIRADQGQNGWVSPSSGCAPVVAPTSLSPGATTPSATNTASFVDCNSAELQDDILGVNFGLVATSATEYNWYTSPPSSTNPQGPPGPVEQILVYNLADNPISSNNLVNVKSGDIEVEFNYDGNQSSTNTSMAQFTIGGYTYSAAVGSIYSGENDFLFSASGGFLGSLTTDSSDNTIISLSSTSKDGWTQTPSGGPGTLTAPEIDSSSATGALTLLMGLLAVMQGRMRPRARALNGC